MFTKKSVIISILTLATIVLGLCVMACNKIKESSMSNEKAVKNECQFFNEERGIGIPFSWEWKRPKYNCNRGFGICNFTIGKPRPVPQESSAFDNNDAFTTFLQFDERGDCFVDLCIIGNEVFDDTDRNLYVDEDVCEFGSDSLYYIISQGVYPIDTLLGAIGGYRIPIQRISSITF